jgi:phosphatidylserine decarboxylase
MPSLPHQYIDRETGLVKTERLYHDRLVQWLYSLPVRAMPGLLDRLTSPLVSDALGYLAFDVPLASARRFVETLGIDLRECLDPPERLDTPRKVFERKIRYEDFRPMPVDPGAVVSPADARMLPGSFAESSHLYLKGLFFGYEELLGSDKPRWLEAFRGGDCLIFRLTPDRYHYSHTPVAGRVVDHYAIDGGCHSCNPGAIVAEVRPYSKNRRVVTVIDTDVEGGTGVGLVAMLEVVALMIGDVVQCYSEEGYENPSPMRQGMHLRRGQPKSLYRPGSSTDVLIFQRGKVRLAPDVVRNAGRTDARSRFSAGFGRALVETDVKARSMVAERSIAPGILFS